MRKFYLESKEGLLYDLQDRNKCFFNNPSGLGFSKDNSYIDIGDYYVNDDTKNSQKTISGELVFIKDYYKNFNDFISFIKSSEEYKLVYVINDTNYYIDVDIVSIEKSDTQKRNCLVCSITMKSKSLWYKTTSKVISIQEDAEASSSKWDVVFDFTFYDNLYDNISINNQGQVKSAFEIEINGSVKNPKIEIYQNKELINELYFNILLENVSDKIIYGNKDNDLYIYKIINGAKINAIDSLLLENDNWFKLPIGNSTMKVSSEAGTITSIKLTYYEGYEAV